MNNCCSEKGILCDNGHIIKIDFSYRCIESFIPPELGSISKLKILVLSYNYFNGTIPPELGNLTDLFSLKLNNNELTGSIPPDLGKLSNLEILTLEMNNLSGPVPPELENLSKINSMEVDDSQCKVTSEKIQKSLNICGKPKYDNDNDKSLGLLLIMTIMTDFFLSLILCYIRKNKKIEKHLNVIFLIIIGIILIMNTLAVLLLFNVIKNHGSVYIMIFVATIVMFIIILYGNIEKEKNVYNDISSGKTHPQRPPNQNNPVNEETNNDSCGCVLLIVAGIFLGIPCIFFLISIFGTISHCFLSEPSD